MLKPMTLHYKHSASCLNEAMPLGNGKMAAMVYGDTVKETIQLDDATFWSGEPSRNNNREDTPALIRRLRALLLAHDYKEADRLGKAFVGVKHNYGTHLPLGKLLLEHVSAGKAADLERSLDLLTGISRTSFALEGNVWHRECFVSYPAGVFALHYAPEHTERFSLRIRWESIENDVHFSRHHKHDLLLRGSAFETLHSDGKTGVSLNGRMRILTDGELSFSDRGAEITGATEIVIFIALESSMTSDMPDNMCLQLLESAEKAGYAKLRDEHADDVCEKMQRVNFSLGEAEDSRPTDERIKSFQKGAEDLGLMVLAFQYGRYVTLASSRESSPLPTHMGGIWNDNIYNKQDSTQDMHIDMNLQMQYWPAFPCGLAECFAPVTRWMRDTLVPSGREAARVAYGTKGWAAHVTSNPWGFAALGWAYNWGSFTFGGAWCATLLWDYFEYTRDMEYLRSEAYPILLECAEFMLDYLFFDENSGFWMTGPSYSPENHYLVEGEQFTLSLSTTCDILFVREIFSIVLRSARLLELPEDHILCEISERMPKLPPYRIGKHGQIQEWFYDFEEPIPNHRHQSHLLGLYPYAQITPENAPALAKAATASIQRRLNGFEKTSWGYNMFAGMYARLYDGEAAKNMLDENIRKLMVPNMTIVMPAEVAMWAGTWELDGNTGLSAAICEMIAQSRAVSDERGELYEIRLLPALPARWTDGELRGLRLRGGLMLDVSWRGGKLLHAVLMPTADIRIAIMNASQTEYHETKANTEIHIQGIS